MEKSGVRGWINPQRGHDSNMPPDMSNVKRRANNESKQQGT